MNKGIICFLVVVAASFASNVWAANLISATELENQINAMDAQAYSSYGAMEYECFAHNERGQQFRAFGRFPQTTQQEAMSECYHFSHRCFAEGCRPR